MSSLNIDDILEKSKSFASPTEQATFLMQQGKECAFQEKMHEAEVCFTQALEIQKAIKDIPNAANSLYMLGQIWAGYEDFESAALVLKEAYQIFQKLGATQELQEVQETIAQIEMAALSKTLGKEQMEALLKTAQSGDRDALKAMMEEIQSKVN